MEEIKQTINPKSFITKISLAIGETVIAKCHETYTFCIGVANSVLFMLRVVQETISREFELKEFLYQCYSVGYRSLPLISVTGTIMGLVLTIQSRPVLISFGAVGMLPGMVAVSLVREMGPVITALICAGKISSGMGAELGSMRVTEQIDAMEVSSIHPVRFLLVTRILAAILMVPLLIIYADALGVFGSWIGINLKGDVSLSLFFSQAFSHVHFSDLIPAFIKSFFFGAIIGVVGCYKGYNAGRGTESVGKAANSAVVLASLLIIVVDVIAVQITDMLTK